jgi:hypothetical protein
MKEDVTFHISKRYAKYRGSNYSLISKDFFFLTGISQRLLCMDFPSEGKLFRTPIQAVIVSAQAPHFL